ncbi:hypothetical protein [Calorimonas adulescens]|uniref:hypothetical protein n=1 Tax=Calorimonas adulescens TaxID=2606906 RepID=UPI001396C3B4|nr:hypothetical protein [Calorimonas adulescens]
MNLFPYIGHLGKTHGIIDAQFVFLEEFVSVFVIMSHIPLNYFIADKTFFAG